MHLIPLPCCLCPNKFEVSFSLPVHPPPAYSFPLFHSLKLIHRHRPLLSWKAKQALPFSHPFKIFYARTFLSPTLKSIEERVGSRGAEKMKKVQKRREMGSASARKKVSCPLFFSFFLFPGRDFPSSGFTHQVVFPLSYLDLLFLPR